MNQLKKYGFRILAALGIFGFFQLTEADLENTLFVWTDEDTAYLIFILIVVPAIWGISEKVVNHFDRSILCKHFSKRKLIFIFWIDTVALIPLILAVNYFSVFELKIWLECPSPYPVAEFWANSAQSLVIAWLVITYQLSQLNFKHAKRAENQNALMQKELLQSKYESLKNQVNPHFLFNSFSVLSSLIHDDPDLASKFLSQLSKMYRYMLDNRDNEMVLTEQRSWVYEVLYFPSQD